MIFMLPPTVVILLHMVFPKSIHFVTQYYGGTITITSTSVTGGGGDIWGVHRAKK